MNTLLPIGQLFRETFALYRERFPVLAGLIAVPIVLNIGAAITGSEAPILGLVLAIAAVVFFVAGYLALAYALIEKSGFQISYQFAFRSFFRYAWLAFLVNITNIGGFIMGIIPGIIFSVWFMFSLFLFVAEGARGMGAMLRSKEYVRGLWWPIFGRMVLAGLLVSGISALWGIFAGQPNRPIAQIAAALYQLLALPFFAVYVYKIFESLRTIKPELANQPAPAKKGFFVFSAVLGVAASILILMGAVIFGPEFLRNGYAPLPQNYEIPQNGG